MKNKIFLSLTVALFSLALCAQNNKAKTILDKTSAAIRNAGDIKAEFSASSSGNSMNGTIFIHKNMLHLQSANIKCWYDGKTLWTYLKNSNEVNITTPSAAEQQSINPYLFINIYKKGYTYTSKDVTQRSKQCFEVTLNATSSANKIKKMVITIDKSNYYPLQVKMQRSKGGETVINILSCKTKQKFAESTFRFNKKDCPGAEVIDLR